MLISKPATHVCVELDGSYYCRNTYADMLSMGFKPSIHATVKLRPHETMADAAHRHTRAEQRYWRSL